MNRLLVILFVCFTLMMPRQAKADAMRELLMSSAYGVLAGTLVGAATLAFTDRPGDNLKSIAVGASLGLYAGILLGLYVIYVVPDGDESEEAEGDVYPTESNRPVIYPIISDNNTFEGAGVSMKVLSF